MNPHDLPLDFSHPAVRDYVGLIRLQVLNPLAVLVHGATIFTCQLLVSPSLGKIAEMYPTSITPSTTMLAIFWVALLGSQIGYCLLIVLAFRHETKQTIVHGVGMPMVFANWLMAAWAVSWAFQSFVSCTILISLAVVLLLFTNLRLYIIYPPSISHPIDYLLLHLPLRLFLLLPLVVLLPLSVFLMQGHSWSPGKPDLYYLYQWEGATVIISSGILAMLLIAWRLDLVWGAGTIWLQWSIASARPKSTPVVISTILFTVLIPLTFVVALVIYRIRKNREGTIRLEDADRTRGRTGVLRSPPADEHPHGGEINPEDVWATGR